MLFLSCRVSQRDRDVPKVINPRREGTDRARTKDTWVYCVSGELSHHSDCLTHNIITLNKTWILYDKYCFFLHLLVRSSVMLENMKQASKSVTASSAHFT